MNRHSRQQYMMTSHRRSSSDYDYDEKCAMVSRRDIAQTCNMSVRNIDRILSQLVKKDLIRVQKRYAPSGRQIENSYKLIYRDYRS